MDPRLNKQGIFNRLKSELEQNLDFDSYLSQTIKFDDRHWTAGQFLYKYFLDELRSFAEFSQGHFASLTGREKELAEQLKIIEDKELLNPQKAYLFMKEGGKLDLFKGDIQKENDYRKLFSTPNRAAPGHPGYWSPVAQFQTAFVAYMLSQMGMTEEQIFTLMTHCEKERERALAKTVCSMPEQVVPHTVFPKIAAHLQRIGITASQPIYS